MTIHVRTLSDRLVEVVRGKILSGEIAPDAAVRQDALAEELQVSKIPLREALGRLEQEGLLRSRANRGYVVSPMTAAEAEEVFALRLKLEPEAVAAAATAALDDDRAEAMRTLSALREEIAAHSPAVGAANRDFHLALVRPGGKAVTYAILERLHVLADRYVHKHLEPLGRDERAMDEHDEILIAWLARDAVEAADLTRRHIETTLADLRVQLARGQGTS